MAKNQNNPTPGTQREIAAALERRIVQHLDGELPADETATLYREVLRDPAARAMLDDYTQNDALAREALALVIDGGGTEPGAGDRDGAATFDVDTLPARDEAERGGWSGLDGGRGWSRWIAVAASVVVTASLGLVLAQNFSHPQGAPPFAKGGSVKANRDATAAPVEAIATTPGDKTGAKKPEDAMLLHPASSASSALLFDDAGDSAAGSSDADTVVRRFYRLYDKDGNQAVVEVQRVRTTLDATPDDGAAAAPGAARE